MRSSYEGHEMRRIGCPRILFKLNELYEEHVQPVLDWLPTAKATVLCSHCMDILRKRFPQPVDVHLQRLPPVSNGLVVRTGIPILHRSLRDALKPYMQGFVFGKCFDANGRLIEDYVTHYCEQYNVLRGGGGTPDSTHLCRGTRYWICGDCGTISSSPEKIPSYILSSTLDKEREVFENASGFLLMSQKVKDSIDWSRWPTACLDPVEIRDAPLPDDPFPKYEKAYRELKSAFGGDMIAATRTIQAEAARLNKPNGVYWLRMEIRGVHLAAQISVIRGETLVGTMYSV